MLFAGLAFASEPPPISKEYQVKAAFLFNFTKFVEWPSERFSSRDTPIVIAVLGRNPFGDELEKLVRNRLVDGRPVVVQPLLSAEEAKSGVADFHVLFVAAGEEAHFADLLKIVPLVGVLTVGESDRFASFGGTVTFVVVESRVRFEINRAAAEAAGLKLSAQLQKLAAAARPSGGSPP